VDQQKVVNCFQGFEVMLTFSLTQVSVFT